MDSVLLPPFRPTDEILKVRVPASKSILNRALILAALSNGTVKLHCGPLAEDTRAMLGCLDALGIRTEPENDDIKVYGCGGDIPVKTAVLDVKSAGTAARFLTVALAFCGGNYTFTSSKQMQKRPMEVLSVLENCGIELTFDRGKYRFPFRMKSNGISVDSLTVNTDISTQYASGILLAASVKKSPFTLRLTGGRTAGSYINVTLNMLESFNIPYSRKGSEITVFPQTAPPREYTIEPDVSGACYFYALALLCSARILVRDVHINSTQGDMKFLRLLEEKGVKFTDSAEGLLADGRAIKQFNGFDADMRDFSDQTLTAAALAPFASSPSVLRNVKHIRLQECDRIKAICENLNALGVAAHSDGDDIYITPATIRTGTVNSYGDHRVAMAFALVTLKTGKVTIKNPLCCKKTFENYFDILNTLTK